MIVVVIWWLVSIVVCAVAGQRVGSERGRSGLGLFLGLFFSVLGLIAISVIPSTPEAEASRQLAIERSRREMEGPQRAPMTYGWRPDPLGRHEERLWDGGRWTRDVRDGGARSEDPDPVLAQLAAPR